jgi:hypothetical protein
MKSQKIIFFICILLALVTFWDFPFIKNIKLLVVLIHEICHAMATLLTGGVVKKILLHSREAGETIIEGNKISFLFIVSAGYIGTSILGGFFLWKGFEKKHSRIVLFCVGLTLIIFSIFFSDKHTLAYKTGLQSGIFFLILSPISLELSSILLIFLGSTVGLYSIYDISDFKEQLMNTDAGILANWILGKKELFFFLNRVQLAYSIAFIWTSISVFSIFQILKKTFKEKDRFEHLNSFQRHIAESNVSPDVAKWFFERGLDLNGKPLSKNWTSELRKGKD